MKATHAPWLPRLELPAGMWEEAVAIPVGEGCLKGNLIGGGEGDLGVLFLHGWGGVRAGPHELLTTIARALADDGLPSLRFDFRGRGESDLDPGAVTLGHMGEDAVAAARFLLRRLGLKRLWIVGLCSGGNVGIGVLDRLPEVDGLFLLSVYPFGEADSFRRDAARTAHFLKRYWQKLWQPTTWRRAFSGEISYRGVLAVLLSPHRRDRRKADAGLAVAGEQTPAPRSPLDNLLTRRIPVHMLYGDADPDFRASYDYFAAFSASHEYGIALATLAGANHNFYSATWKAEIIRRLRAMIEEHA